MTKVIRRLPHLVQRTTLSRTTIWRKVRAGEFPAPITLGVNSIGWPDEEIEAWLDDRPRRTYGAKTIDEPGEESGHEDKRPKPAGGN